MDGTVFRSRRLLSTTTSASTTPAPTTPALTTPAPTYPTTIIPAPTYPATSTPPPITLAPTYPTATTPAPTTAASTAPTAITTPTTTTSYSGSVVVEFSIVIVPSSPYFSPTSLAAIFVSTEGNLGNGWIFDVTTVYVTHVTTTQQ